MTNRTPQRCSLLSVVGAFVVLASRSGRADVPTSCVTLGKMQTTIAYYTAGRKTYLPVHGGTPVSATNPADPMINHVRDLFLSGYDNDIDPRFEAAIAGAESHFGTDCDLPSKPACAAGNGTGETAEINDNAFGW